jgi:hypothetical protein
MHAKLSRYMTTLGLFAMIFYGSLMAMGFLSVDMMPQFLVSAVIFLTSGRIMRKAAKKMRRPQRSDPRIDAIEPTAADAKQTVLEWVAAISVLLVLAVALMKPVDLTISDAWHDMKVDDLYYSATVP